MKLRIDPLPIDAESGWRRLMEILRRIRDVFDGRIDLVTGTKAVPEEGNLYGQVKIYTTNAVANNEDTVAHTLGRAPIGFLILNRDKAGVVYDGGTAWTATNIYLKCDTASTTVTIWIF